MTAALTAYSWNIEERLSGRGRRCGQNAVGTIGSREKGRQNPASGQQDGSVGKGTVTKPNDLSSSHERILYKRRPIPANCFPLTTTNMLCYACVCMCIHAHTHACTCTHKHKLTYLDFSMLPSTVSSVSPWPLKTKFLRTEGGVK